MKKIPIEVIIIGCLIIICALFAFLALGIVGKKRDQAQVQNLNIKEDSSVACTMDAKICPDGSSVGRVAPNCEFAVCPSTPAQQVKELPKLNNQPEDEVSTGPIKKPKIIPHTPIIMSSVFDKQITAKLGDIINYPDGLAIKIISINDGRCPQNVMCVWAGEVTITMEFSGPNFTTKITSPISTMTKKEITVNGYKISLINADQNQLTFIVKK